jgi:hypothetical protein
VAWLQVSTQVTFSTVIPAIKPGASQERHFTIFKLIPVTPPFLKNTSATHPFRLPKKKTIINGGCCCLYPTKTSDRSSLSDMTPNDTICKSENPPQGPRPIVTLIFNAMFLSWLCKKMGARTMTVLLVVSQRQCHARLITVREQMSKQLKTFINDFSLIQQIT